MVFLYTPFFCLSSPSFSVALSYCISYTCIVLFFFLSDFLLEQIYKFRFSCQLALYIYPTFRKVWCFYCYKKCFQNKQHISVVVLYTCTFSYSRGKQISWILPLFANFFLQQLEWTITKYLQQLFGDLNAQQKLDNKLTIIISIKKVNWILHCQWFFFLFFNMAWLIGDFNSKLFIAIYLLNKCNTIKLSTNLWHSESPFFANVLQNIVK